jgi:HemY protein
MIRGLWFFAQLAVLVIGAVWLAEQQGPVSVEWHGWLMETSAGVLILIVLVMALVVIVLWRIWRSVLGTPHAIGRFRHRRQRSRSYTALVRSLAAISSGEGATALRHASEAEAIGDPAIAHLAAARAAEMAGDVARAAEEYTRLSDRPDTAVIGLRGLTALADRQGDLDQALALVRKARKLAPKSPWAAKRQFELEKKSGALDVAERTLADASKLGAIAPHEADGLLCALLVERAERAVAAGNFANALSDAERAHKTDPNAVEAAALAARLYAQAGRAPAAERVLARTWTVAPDARLARGWMALVPKADTTQRVRQAERLVALNRDSDQARMALAEAELSAGRWAEARAHLGRLGLQAQLSGRFCQLMAYLEAASANEAAAHDWFEKSLDAPDGPSPRPVLLPAA